MHNIILGWLARRALEVGGLAGVVLTAWNNLPPELQTAVLALLTQNWQAMTLGTLVSLASAIGGYVWSWVSTMRPQVVVDGRQVPLDKLPPQANVFVEEAARTAIARQPRSVLDRLLEQLNKPER
jgi:hypothetical protein